MKIYEVVAVSSLLLISFAFGVITRVYNLNFIVSVLVISLFFFTLLTFLKVHSSLEQTQLNTLSKKMVLMGRGIPTSFIRKQILLVEIAIITILTLSTYNLITLRVGKADPLLIISLIGSAILLVVSLYLIRFRVSFTIASRKTSAEVELPFFLSFIWSMSETHLTLYDLFSMIERSVALKAWSKEIAFAKKLASALNTSLIQALNTLSETHPSPIVKDIFKRIVTVGHGTGSARNVVRKAFRYIYEQMQDRLLKLTEKLDVVNGVIIFGFLFLPIILATTSPISGYTAVDVFFITLIVEVSLSLIMYAFISHIYPSGFVIITPKYLTLMSFISVFFSMVFIFIYLHPALTTIHLITMPQVDVMNWGLHEHVLFVLVITSLTPSFIYSEMWLRRVRNYVCLLKLISDAVEVSVSTGENFVSVLERMMLRESQQVQRLVRMLVSGYRSDDVRRMIVSKAPSIFYASFIEAVLYSLLIGAHPKVLTTIVNTYESMERVAERIGRLSRTLEVMIVCLSGMLGFFIKYLEKMFSNFFGLISAAGKEFYMTQAIFTVFQFSPSTFVALTGVSLITLIVVSLFTGKTRGGSLIYGMRTAEFAIICYAVGRLAVTYM